MNKTIWLNSNIIRELYYYINNREPADKNLLSLGETKLSYGKKYISNMTPRAYFSIQ